MSDTKYYFVPGMWRPYWCVHQVENYPTVGESTVVAHNRESDTDMGDLFGDEFKTYFPHAVEISRDEYDNAEEERG
jgi:hypothetical protein